MLRFGNNCFNFLLTVLLLLFLWFNVSELRCLVSISCSSSCFLNILNRLTFRTPSDCIDIWVVTTDVLNLNIVIIYFIVTPFNIVPINCHLEKRRWW